MKKKIITIQGNSNTWYEKAIFVTKKEREKEIPKDFVEEAEDIINRFILKTSLDAIVKTESEEMNVQSNNKKSSNKESSKKIVNNIDKYLYYSIFLCVAMLIISLIVQIF